MRKITSLLAIVMFIYGCSNRAEFIANNTYTFCSMDSTEHTAVFEDAKGVKNTYSLENCTIDLEINKTPITGERYFVVTAEVNGKTTIYLLSNQKINQ